MSKSNTPLYVSLRIFPYALIVLCCSSITIFHASCNAQSSEPEIPVDGTNKTLAHNPIQLENQHPGTRDWQLTRVRLDAGGFRSPWIEGYCSRQSVHAGETIDIFVSTNPVRQFKVEFFQMGYYGGRGGSPHENGRFGSWYDSAGTTRRRKESSRVQLVAIAAVDDSK